MESHGQPVKKLKRGRSSAALLALILILPGCGTASDQDGPFGAPGTSRFEEKDLVRILPRPAGAPEGMRFTKTIRGQAVLQRLLTLSTSDEARQSGVSARYMAGVEREFEHPRGQLIQTGALLFEKTTVAQEFFKILFIDYEILETVEGGIEPVKALSSPGLGEDSFGTRGSLVPLSPRETVVLLVWWQRNLILYVRAFGVTGERGSADKSLARQMAEAMDAEASP